MQPLHQQIRGAVQGTVVADDEVDWEHERLRAALPDFRALSPDALVEKDG